MTFITKFPFKTNSATILTEDINLKDFYNHYTRLVIPIIDFTYNLTNDDILKEKIYYKNYVFEHIGYFCFQAKILKYINK